MAQSPQSLTIGTLSKTCNVSAPNIRYYEKIGLMPKAERNQSGQRRYTDADVQRLTFIRRSRAFGFSTQHVRALLSVPTGNVTDCATSREIAQTRLHSITAQIQDLLALEKDLKSLIRSCDDTCANASNTTCGAFTKLHLPT